MKEGQETYNDLDDDIRDAVLGIALRERCTKENDHGYRIHKARVDDDADDVRKAVWVDGAVDSLPAYVPYSPDNHSWRPVSLRPITRATRKAHK